MKVAVRREVTVLVEQVAVIDVPDPSWLDTVEGQDFLDVVQCTERPLEYLEATTWVATDPSAVPSKGSDRG